MNNQLMHMHFLNMFDMYVRANLNQFSFQVIGLRYFNVYGSSEFHKGSMASPVFQFNKQLIETGK